MSEMKKMLKRVIQESLDNLREDNRVERLIKTPSIKCVDRHGNPIFKSHAMKSNDQMRFCLRAITSKMHNKRFTVNLSPQELYEVAIRTPVCPLCGCELVYAKAIGHNPRSASLDRINNEDTIDRFNSWIICKKCNTTKSNRTLDEFKAYCRMIGTK